MEEVSDDLHTDAAGGEGREEDEEERGYEGHGNGDEYEDEEPDDRPRPAESHRRVLVENERYLCCVVYTPTVK